MFSFLAPASARARAAWCGAFMTLATPAVCLAAVDVGSAAYRNGRIAGAAVVAVIVALALRKFLEMSWALSLALGAVIFGGWYFTTQQRGSGRATELTQASVEAFVVAGSVAADRRDVATMCEQFAETAKIRLVTIRFSGSEVSEFNKAQWCEQLQKTYAALPAGLVTESRIHFTGLDIDAEGIQAEVSMEVNETMRMGPQTMSGTSTQRATVQLIDGHPRYVTASARVNGGQ